MSMAITLTRVATVAGYTGLSKWLTASGPTEFGIWVLTVVGAFCVAYILAADWISSGRPSGERALLLESQSRTPPT